MTARIWTVANVLMLGMFILSTVVQFNDPDAPRWIAIYAAAAVITGLEIRRRAPLWAAAAIAVVAYVWAAFANDYSGTPLRALVQHWEMQDVRVEEAREMYGLLIVAVWMTAVALAAGRRRTRGTRAASPANPS